MKVSYKSWHLMLASILGTAMFFGLPVASSSASSAQSSSTTRTQASKPKIRAWIGSVQCSTSSGNAYVNITYTDASSRSDWVRFRTYRNGGLVHSLSMKSDPEYKPNVKRRRQVLKSTRTKQKVTVHRQYTGSSWKVIAVKENLSAAKCL